MSWMHIVDVKLEDDELFAEPFQLCIRCGEATYRQIAIPWILLKSQLPIQSVLSVPDQGECLCSFRTSSRDFVLLLVWRRDLKGWDAALCACVYVCVYMCACAFACAAEPKTTRRTWIYGYGAAKFTRCNESVLISRAVSSSFDPFWPLRFAASCVAFVRFGSNDRKKTEKRFLIGWTAWSARGSKPTDLFIPRIDRHHETKKWTRQSAEMAN